MELIDGIAVFEDKEKGIVLCFLEKDIEFCDNCPTKKSKDGILKDADGKGVAIHRIGDCPCRELKARASASISTEARRALEETWMWKEFLGRLE